MTVVALSRRRRKFASEYVKNGFNGVQAVFSAGYKQGYASAGVEACRLLKNAKVVALVEEHLKAAKMDADEVLARLAEIARQDAKFSGADVVKATELLGKGHKLFTDKVETVDNTPLTPDTLKALQTLAEKFFGYKPEESELQKLLDESFARAEVKDLEEIEANLKPRLPLIGKVSRDEFKRNIRPKGDKTR